jgi:hypothetical protein
MTTTNQATGTTLEHQVGPRGRFTLRQSSGDVSIRGVEGGAIRVRSRDDANLDDIFQVELGDGSVELRQIERLGIGIKIFGRHEGASLMIEVPHGATIAIDTQSADVKASDLSGPKSFKSASGEISLERLAGTVEVETVSGEIELDGQAPLDLAARSVSGDVRVRVPTLRRLELGTTSGDIRLDAQLVGDGPFAVRSISGDATIVGRSGFRVEAESITGDLSSDLPSRRESIPGRKVLIVGRPGPTLTFRSVSGDFHVAAPRDAAMPEVPPRDPTTLDEGPAGSSAFSPEAPAETAEAGPQDEPPPAEDARMEVLRALERGDITVAEATDRLSRLDEVLR